MGLSDLKVCTYGVSMYVRVSVTISAISAL